MSVRKHGATWCTHILHWATSNQLLMFCKQPPPSYLVAYCDFPHNQYITMHCFCIKTMPLYSQEKVSSGTSRYYYIQNSSYRQRKKLFFFHFFFFLLLPTMYAGFICGFFKCVECDTTFILSYKALKNYTITHQLSIKGIIWSISKKCYSQDRTNGELTEMRSHHFRFPDLYQSFLLLKKYLLVVHISRMGYIMSK